MTKRSIAAVIALLALLALILAAPYLLLHQQEAAVLRRVQTQTVDESVYRQEAEQTTLLERINLSVDPKAVPSWLAQEMVAERISGWDKLLPQLRQELQLLTGLSAAELVQFSDAGILYYYLPEKRQTASFVSCIFAMAGGQLTLELDLTEERLVALDFQLSESNSSGLLQILAAQLQSSDWERRWATYLGLEYQEDGRPLATFRTRDGLGTVVYQRMIDGTHFSWKPVSTASTAS